METQLLMLKIIINKTQLVMTINPNLITIIMKHWLGTLLVFKVLKFKLCIKVQILNLIPSKIQQDKFTISPKLLLLIILNQLLPLTNINKIHLIR